MVEDGEIVWSRGFGQVFSKQHPDYFGSAAGVVASAEDMVTFSMAIDEGRFLSSDTWEPVFTPATSDSGSTLPYGLGVDNDVMKSDVARLFVEAYVLGNQPLP